MYGERDYSRVLEAFHPNRAVTPRALRLIAVMWAATSVAFWALIPSVLIPSPMDVLRAFQTVWADGLLHELVISFTVYAEALAITAAASLVAAYLTVVPAIRPPAAFIAKSRFLGIAGLTFILTLYLGGGHRLKIALLVFGMSVFTLEAMARVVASIPREKFDHARTLRMSEWRVVWEVVILGKADVAIDILRQNAAMGWMMLPMVEGIVRSEGGVGAMLLAQSKHFHLAEVFAVQVAILLVGLAQDYVIGLVREFVCPYADLSLERR